MTDPVPGGRPRRGHLESWLTPQTVVEGLGLVGVAIGLWLVVGVSGVAAAAVVAAVLYTLSGVYAFGAGQFVLAITVPARITPELVVVELGLVLVLVGEDVVTHGLGRVALVAAALTLVAVSVGTNASGREGDVALLAGVGFVLVAGALWVVTRSVEAGAARDVRDAHADGGRW